MHPKKKYVHVKHRKTHMYMHARYLLLSLGLEDVVRLGLAVALNLDSLADLHR